MGIYWSRSKKHRVIYMFLEKTTAQHPTSARLLFFRKTPSCVGQASPFQLTKSKKPTTHSRLNDGSSELTLF
ncbi:hypothetical protein D3C74_265960 [compost metagenome]